MKDVSGGKGIGRKRFGRKPKYVRIFVECDGKLQAEVSIPDYIPSQGNIRYTTYRFEGFETGFTFRGFRFVRRNIRMKQVVVVGDENRRGVRDAVSRVKDVVRASARLQACDLKGELSLSDIRADMIISLGGDGTVLGTIRRLGKNQRPLLGINLGKVGFLTALEKRDVETKLPGILRNGLNVDRRMRLSCAFSDHSKGTLSEPGEAGTSSDPGDVMGMGAINEIVVSRDGVSRMISLDIRVDEEEITSFSGDGLLVSTPTGSTAHNLSAGGPVLAPNVNSLVITPLVPQSLTLRPVVVSASSRITVRLKEGSRPATVTADGWTNRKLPGGEGIEIKTSGHPAKLVGPPDQNFFERLNRKLDWGGGPAHSTGE